MHLTCAGDKKAQAYSGTVCWSVVNFLRVLSKIKLQCSQKLDYLVIWTELQKHDSYATDPNLKCTQKTCEFEQFQNILCIIPCIIT